MGGGGLISPLAGHHHIYVAHLAGCNSVHSGAMDGRGRRLDANQARYGLHRRDIGPVVGTPRHLCNPVHLVALQLEPRWYRAVPKGPVVLYLSSQAEAERGDSFAERQPQHRRALNSDGCCPELHVPFRSRDSPEIGIHQSSRWPKISIGY